MHTVKRLAGHLVWSTLCALLAIGVLPVLSTCASQWPAKQRSVFYPPELVARARANAQRHPWAARIQSAVLAMADPWMALSDEKLWRLVFGPTITRAHFVNETAPCPACKQPAFTWIADPWRHPWKMRCATCGVLFPTNDFKAFYDSGLDSRGVFDPALADRSLLFNAEHPDPADPLHGFGVDDGEGWVDGQGARYRFIGNYLLRGQWQQLVWGGITRLAAAYVVSGDCAYAHKAAILLDRVADLYPEFDYLAQGRVYGESSNWGYVTYWCDSSPETQLLAVAYDMIFDALGADAALVAFLRQKAAEHGLSNSKACLADICRNIEERILRDALAEANRPPGQPSKMFCNYPQQDLTALTIEAILGWPSNRDTYLARLEPMLQTATRVDGVTGEKGLPGYSRWGLQRLAYFLERWATVEPDLLKELFERVPTLRETWRFHSDTHFLGKYYPCEGDAGLFAMQYPRYVGVDFLPQGAVGDRESSLPPSMYSFLLRLYALTGDPIYAQIAHRENGCTLQGLPHDLFAADPAAAQATVAAAVAQAGATPRPASVNKRQWHIACLRSGEGESERGVWLDYDSGQPLDPFEHAYSDGHGHRDGMNLGLFAKGLDLMPDFGYPPLQFGGFNTPQALWYKMTAAHNTVVVDKKDQPTGVAGETTLWGIGDTIRAIRASAPGLNGGNRYERTVAMVDISENDSYLLDVFRVAGGTDHAKFMGSHFGTVTLSGLSLADAAEFGHGTLMRAFRTDPAPAPGWSVDWSVEDRYRYLDGNAQVHLRYTDLTSGAQASVCEAWIAPANEPDGAWIPRVVTRRTSPPGSTELFSSTFVAVIEPYHGRSAVAGIRRLPLLRGDGSRCGDGDVAVEVSLADGRRDVLIATDVERGKGRLQRRLDVAGPLLFVGDLCLVRFAASGQIERVALCNARGFSAGGMRIQVRRPVALLELAIGADGVIVVHGDAQDRASVFGTPQAPNPN